MCGNNDPLATVAVGNLSLAVRRNDLRRRDNGRRRSEGKVKRNLSFLFRIKRGYHKCKTIDLEKAV